MGLFLYRQYINDNGVIQLNVIITGFIKENQMVTSHVSNERYQDEKWTVSFDHCIHIF